MIRILSGLFLLTFAVQPLSAQKLTILHTNDMHSRLMGYGPEADYTPLTVHDDQTVGGFARIATIISDYKNRVPGSLMVVDAGDFSMGTIFHTVEAETGFQLRLMKKMGYDLAAIGNHEFDFGIDMLAKMLAKSAEQEIPGMLLSNISFNPDSTGDDALENLYKTGVLKTWRTLNRNGLKIGFFSLIGIEAGRVAPYVRPAVFSDRIGKAREMVKFLRESEKADVVICLSHCGLLFDTKKGWIGEDVEMAKEVPGLDLIISGHSHTSLDKPLIVNNIPIVQAGGEGRYVGKLEIEKTPQGLVLHSGELIPVNDGVPGDPGIQRMILDQQHLISKKLFEPYGFRVDKPVVETSFDLNFSEQSCLENSNLGPFLADAIWGYLREVYPTDVVLVTAGLTRDEIIRGQTGKQLPADLFRIFPLGLGTFDKAPGYSMAQIFVTGAELKTILDVMLYSGAKSSGTYVYWSGIRFKYNTLRMPLDRVYDIELGNDKDGYEAIRISKDDNDCYSIASNIYVLEFFGLIKEVTKGILTVVPKDGECKPIAGFKQSIMDMDPNQPGIQEIKEWVAVMKYAASLPDTNGNGIPDIPEKYREVKTSAEKSASLNPVKLFRATNGITVVPAVLEVGIAAGILLLIL